MSVAAYIVVALAIAISDMLLLRRCTEPLPVRLIRGLGITLLVSIVQTGLYLLGIAIGDLLRIESASDASLFARANAFIMLGLFVFVILKQLFPYLRREPKLPLFNLTDNKSVVAMAFASGINVLLTGLGMGFASPMESHMHIAVWPMLALTFLFGMLGIMFGRQKVSMRPRRWMVVACVLLLGTAIACVVNA